MVLRKYLLEKKVWLYFFGKCSFFKLLLTFQINCFNSLCVCGHKFNGVFTNTLTNTYCLRAYWDTSIIDLWLLCLCWDFHTDYRWNLDCIRECDVNHRKWFSFSSNEIKSIQGNVDAAMLEPDVVSKWWLVVLPRLQPKITTSISIIITVWGLCSLVCNSVPETKMHCLNNLSFEKKGCKLIFYKWSKVSSSEHCGFMTSFHKMLLFFKRFFLQQMVDITSAIWKKKVVSLCPNCYRIQSTKLSFKG